MLTPEKICDIIEVRSDRMIGSVQKTIKILNTISEKKNNPVSLSAISKITSINKSTCSHILSTLESEGFIKKISHTKGYVLGPAAYCLSRHGRYENEFVSICHPLINWLHKKTGYSVILAVVEGSRKYTIDYIDTEDKILPEISEIMPDDIYRTATGRIIMANMDKSDIKGIFEKNGIPPEGHWDEVSSFETLEEELSKLSKNDIAQTYFARNDGKILLGYAAAIFRYTKCVGALGVAVLCTKEEYEHFEEKESLIKQNIIKARTEIGRRLKYS